jgi:hypothetical protein
MWDCASHCASAVWKQPHWRHGVAGFRMHCQGDCETVTYVRANPSSMSSVIMSMAYLITEGSKPQVASKPDQGMKVHPSVILHDAEIFGHVLQNARPVLTGCQIPLTQNGGRTEPQPLPWCVESSALLWRVHRRRW